ncbi:MAG: hypothetical protein CM15mP120_18440 [Pseudomonadota bacterium]|nr:MAG: hypothetical protein CM15mP120_18440 [Pseudomonadota bacterium]
MVEFEWNDAKANLTHESMVFHLLKPQPSFKMSLPVLCQTPDHSIDEQRYLLLGEFDDASFGCEPLQKSC